MNKIRTGKFFLGRIIVTFFFIVFSFKSFSQEITMQQTLDYVNQKLGGRCSVDVSKGVIISVYQVNGKNVREDQVNISDLDIGSIKYNAQESIFSINCKGSPGKKCVSRELWTIGPSSVYRPYARISWEAYLDEKGAEGMKKAFTHMIRSVIDPKYKSSEPFESN
jgi:hypothetical protein